ncbi:MAG TPA: dehydrogenase [Intrasporangium sp.]|uniref:dehydrogenase n=1 Tax=Intrasporangium sp. TaxID=1925024 RepID=UPI002B47D9A7|nr:dehydrogenase [Intrasporangium sp.]HKX66355.1 dehydrogenase [Intrasporangium sp.]
MATKRRTAKPSEPTLIVDVSLLGHEGDYEERVTLLGKPYRILRIGTNGRVQEVHDLVETWAGQAGAIAITGLREVRATGRFEGDLETIERLDAPGADAPGADVPGADVPGADVPVTTGNRLRDVLQEWAIRHVQSDLPGYFNNARVVVLGEDDQTRAARIIHEFTDNITTSDPLLIDLMERVESVPVVGSYASVGLWPVRQLPGRVQALLRAPGPVSQTFARKAARDSDVVIATYEALVAFGLEDLRGKTVITSAVSPDQLAELARRDVDMVVDPTPQPFDITVDDAVLEAILIAGARPGRLAGTGLVEAIHAAGLEPRVLQPNGPRRKSRFAFVIHPLSQEYLSKVEPLRTMRRVLPGFVMDAVEKAVAYVPPFTYSRVTGVSSPTGAEAEGWLITVGGTPKQLLSHSPEFTYGQLLAAADTAKKLGAQVMGLGAFTKVVGDAGVTVAKRAPLPVTTGNSYSASGALWAAHEALQRLGLIEVDAEGRMRGKAMVVGATGAIGSVCARLLALACDELWMVSPESAKLLALQEEVQRDNPRAEVHVSSSPGRHLGDMDVIVTATSAAGKRILDIMKVKPGCVITDVARPLDLSAEDVAKRPDVFVVESGEIDLPGEVRMKNIGLPKGVAYACLAETVVLALEGRYETFTVGRDIEWEKVKEIYQLGLKHGMRLATISGVNGVFTDDDITRIRRLALERRTELSRGAVSSA